MPTFERSLLVPVPRSSLHAWHMANGAFDRLTPPWQQIRSVYAEPLRDGSRRVFEVKQGGLWMRWEAEHRDVVHPERFTDIQRRGPFSRWVHEHTFNEVEATTSRLVDRVEYELPLGRIGRAVAGSTVRRDIERLFAYRHRTTLGDLRAHACSPNGSPMRIAISGSSGLVGRQLVAFLRTGGHDVIRLVRRASERETDAVTWSPDIGVHDPQQLDGVDAIIHLAGASVAQRWTQRARDEISQSRVIGTRVLVESIAKLPRKPRVFISASAVGYYGDTGREIVDEEAPAGSGFLADVCRAWEAEAQRAQEHGCRAVQLRLGVVLDPRGGALGKLLPIAKLGVGGPVGGGQQWLSWVGLDDVLGACSTALHDDSMQGAINVTGPLPVTQGALAAHLGHVLHRPAFTPTPAAAIETLYGEMGRATVLGSTGVRPSRLIASGYQFRAATVQEALRHCLGRDAAPASEIPAR